MTAATDLITELVRAANKVEKLGTSRKCSLMHNAVTMIREMRGAVGMKQSISAIDAVIDIQTTANALSLGQTSFAQEKTALLEAAEMIRVLKIMADAKEMSGGTTL